MREPLHWPPGAPLLFAVGYKLFGSDGERQDARHPRRLLGAGADHDRDDRARARCWPGSSPGRGPGVLAGAIVGTYPPLIGATGDQLSEPLGAFLLLAAFVALALAVKRRAGPWWFAAAGRAVRARRS